MTFFTQRGYPLTSLEQDLRRVTTIGRPDALNGSERGDTTVDRVPLVVTYHPFNTHIKRYLLQKFGILSTDQQTRDIFPQPPTEAYKRDLSLRDILVHSTDSSYTEKPGSHACQRPRCQTCEFITSLTDIRGPKSTFTIRDHFTCTSENLVYCISCRRCSHIYNRVKLGEVSGVELVSFCEACATTSLDFLWHNISTPPVTVLQMSKCEVCVYVFRKQLEMRLIFQLGTVQPDGLNINFKYV